MILKLTFLSDTHSIHNRLTRLIKGGDVIMHTGDISDMGYLPEIESFLKWFNELDYEYKILVAGNHDFGFQDYPNKIKDMLSKYKNIIYLEDDFIYVGDYPNQIKIYGTPWQPMFHNWAFNLNEDDLIDKLNNIHNDTDILLTHNPPYKILDGGIGCKFLLNKVNQIKPKIHAFGHSHKEKGIRSTNGTHFINGSILNESYNFAKYPINIEWDFKNNEYKLY